MKFLQFGFRCYFDRSLKYFLLLLGQRSSWMLFLRLQKKNHQIVGEVYCGHNEGCFSVKFQLVKNIKNIPFKETYVCIWHSIGDSCRFTTLLTRTCWEMMMMMMVMQGRFNPHVLMKMMLHLLWQHCRTSCKKKGLSLNSLLIHAHVVLQKERNHWSRVCGFASSYVPSYPNYRASFF